jgi:hypothetical protein
MYIRIKKENAIFIEFSEDGLADPEAECAHLLLTPAVLDEASFSPRRFCKVTFIDRVAYGTINLEAMQDLKAFHGLELMMIDKCSEEKFREAISTMAVRSRAYQIMLESYVSNHA